VHLVAALGGDQLRNLLDRVDIGRFQIELANAGETWRARNPVDTDARGDGFAEQVGTSWLEAGIIRENRQNQLPERARLRFPFNLGEHLPAFIDGDVDRVLWHGDTWQQPITVDRHQFAVAIGVEGARARVERLAVWAPNLEPAAAVERQVELVTGMGGRALAVQRADRRRPGAETEPGTFRDMILPGAIRHALQSFGLVEQVGELRPRPLEPGGVHIGDVVGDHL